MAYGNIKDLMKGIFNLTSTCSAQAGSNMGAKDYHIHVVAQEGARERAARLPRRQIYEADTNSSPPFNLWDLLGKGRWIPDMGWVSCVHMPGALCV
jgi:hypothetical protein